MKNESDQNQNKKGKNIWRTIDITLLTILIIFVIYAKISGMYIDKEIQIIEICNGIPTNTTMLDTTIFETDIDTKAINEIQKLKEIICKYEYGKPTPAESNVKYDQQTNQCINSGEPRKFPFTLT